MSLEAVCGLFSIVTALISIIGVAVRVNRAIVLLEAAVDRLNENAKEQKAKNTRLEQKLATCERRVAFLERERINREY